MTSTSASRGPRPAAPQSHPHGQQRPRAQVATGERLLQAVPSAIEALRANKGRALLTMLGIIIGVSAVIAIVGLGQGSTAQITNQLTSLGTNVMTVSPGSTRTGGVQGGAGTVSTLDEADLRAIRREVAGVARISPVVSGTVQLVAGSNNWSTRVHGVWPDYLATNNWKASQGGVREWTASPR